MKVLQINRNYENGGAAIAAKRLHKKLNETDGMSSDFLCRYTGNVSDTRVQQLYPGLHGRLLSVCIDRVERLTGCQYLFQKGINSIINNSAFKEADVVHFHITHGGYINQYLLPEVARLKPVVWTFHDMWALTGRCAHSYNCEKWKTGCGNCPTTNIYPDQLIDRSGYLWELKNRLYADIDVHVVCPSRWLLTKVEQSYIRHWETSVIPNSADLSIFKPGNDIQELKNKLGFPGDKNVFLFVAHGGVDNHYKGFDFLKNSLIGITNYYLVVIGGKNKGDLAYMGVNGVSVGEVNDELLMAEYYSAADFYVIPSIQENQPLTIIESLGCGTPVLAYNVGGIPEMISHKSTGYLANINTNNSLIEAIEWACSLSATNYMEISLKCRDYALSCHSIDAYADKYIKLYESLVKC